MRTDDWLKSRLDKIADSVDWSAVEVAAILAVLDELAGLDVDLHLLPALEKVVLAVNLSGTALTGRVWNDRFFTLAEKILYFTLVEKRLFLQ